MSVNQSKWLGACFLGGLIVVVFGAACLYAASHGGPAWMVGNEFSIFLKLSAVTAVAVVAVQWPRSPHRGPSVPSARGRRGRPAV